MITTFGVGLLFVGGILFVNGLWLRGVGADADVSIFDFLIDATTFLISPPWLFAVFLPDFDRA